MEKILLNDGNSIPSVGFGVFRIPNDGSTYRAVRTALDAGYRHIDTAASYQSAWKALEKLYADGVLRAIGMANCYPHVLADLCETFAIPPMVNQVEMHPFFQQPLNLSVMQDYGVVPEAWAPFNEGRRNFFADPTLSAIGKKYNKTAAQVALRWNIQRGVVVIPKSVHEERIRQNIDVFDFSLSESDMEQIKAMDIGHSEIVDHFDPHWIRFLHSLKV